MDIKPFVYEDFICNSQVVVGIDFDQRKGTCTIQSEDLSTLLGAAGVNPKVQTLVITRWNERLKIETIPQSGTFEIPLDALDKLYPGDCVRLPRLSDKETDD